MRGREELAELCGASAACELLEMYGSPLALASASEDEVRRTAGERAARKLRAALGWAAVVADARADGMTLSDPGTLARYLLDAGWHARPVETFGAVCLDVRHRIIGRPVVISTGCLTASLVHPREVFKVALDRRAAALVVFHNHPSGDPEPSAEDLALTRRLLAAGTLMGVEVLDHVVLGAGRWVSLKTRGVV